MKAEKLRREDAEPISLLPRNRGPFGMLLVTQLVKLFAALHGTRKTFKLFLQKSATCLYRDTN